MSETTLKELKKDVILVVDDQPNNLKVISSVLGDSYSLSFANNGPNALKILENLQPDLILLDVMMPGMDGYEVCQRIKSTEKTKELPVIFLTAKNDIEDILKAFRAGAVDYITKPFNIMELKVRVGNHLSLKHTREQLKNANDKLLQVIHEKDKFFTIIAHDLRNPFIGISSLSQIMVEQLGSLQLDEMEEYAREIHHASTNAFNLLKNLLSWAKSQTGRMDFVPQHLNVQELITETISFIQEAAILKSIEIESQIAEGLSVFADKEMVATVMRNLVSNAVKFTRAGGKVLIRCERSDQHIRISVVDNGIGMTSKMVEEIFRIDVSNGRKGTNGEPSSGIGLLLCKEFTERNGGTITVESQPDQGSTFNITLPVSNF